MKKGQKWSDEQIEYLKANYDHQRASDIGLAINKSKSSVQHKANRLGLGKDKVLFHDIRRKACSGKNSGNFKGYRRKTPRGYIARYAPEHPSATKDGLVMEHRMVIEQELGIILPKEFDVHHINGDKTDNRIENLAIMTHSAHTAMHNRMDNKVPKGEENPIYKKIDIEKAKKLQEQGYSAKEICKLFGVGKTKLYKELRGA